MMMPVQKLIEPAADWTGGSIANRIDQCASMLFVHGYIPQSQREKITRKLEKQFAAAIAKGEIIARDGAQ